MDEFARPLGETEEDRLCAEIEQSKTDDARKLLLAQSAELSRLCRKENRVKNLPLDDKRPKDWNGWSYEERCRAILDMINDATENDYKLEEFGSFSYLEWQRLEVLLSVAFYMLGDAGPSGGWFRERMRAWFDHADIRMQRILEQLSEFEVQR